MLKNSDRLLCVSTASLLTTYLTIRRWQRTKCVYDNEGHYFNVAMRRVYETSRNARPDTSIKRKPTIHHMRAAALKAGVCSPGDDNPYTKIYVGLREACEKQRTALTKQLKTGVRDIFWDIKRDLDLMQPVVRQEDKAVLLQRAMQQYVVEEMEGLLSGYKDWLVRDGIYVEPARVAGTPGLD